MPNMNPFMFPPPQFYYPGQALPFGQYPPTSTPLPIPDKTNVPVKNAVPGLHEYPEVTRWFQFLDEHAERSKDGIHFAQYGAVLKGKGFLRIKQLTLDFFTLKDLQDWLSIDVGTAILIMQYAQEDMDAIKAGRRVLLGPNDM
jgi:hypothetical protein